MGGIWGKTILALTTVQVVTTFFDNTPFRKNGWKQMKQKPEINTYII
jgi:hypothetical protein